MVDPCIELVHATGPDGSDLEAPCALTTGTRVPSQHQLLDFANIQKVFQPILQLLLAKLKELSERTVHRTTVLERTSHLFLIHCVQPQILAAGRNIDNILQRHDEILAVQKEAAIVKHVLIAFENSLKAISGMCGVAPSTQVEFDKIALRATLARAKDTKGTAAYLMETGDRSQQMQRAARDLLIFAKAELKAIVDEHVGDLAISVAWILEDAVEESRKLLDEINSML